MARTDIVTADPKGKDAVPRGAGDVPSAAEANNEISVSQPAADPKAVRKTKILLGVMLFGGVVCNLAYSYALHGAHFSAVYPVVYWTLLGLMWLCLAGLVATVAPQGISGLARRLSERQDSEHEQAILRIVLVILINIFLAFGTSRDVHGASWDWVIYAMSAGLVVSWLIVLHLFMRPQTLVVRRICGMNADQWINCVVMYLGGALTAFMYPIMLFVTFGNGFRYGVRYLALSAAITTLGFGIVIHTSAFWMEIPVLAYGLLAALIVLPAYVATLIRALRLSMAAAEEASQAKSRFLATISHELRTPLTAVIGLSALIRNTELDGEQRGMVRSIRTSAQTLLSLINNILDFSKYEAGNIALRAERFNLYGLFTEIESMFAVQANAKGVRFNVHVAADVPPGLTGDAHHLRDILVNLVGNALKFTETGIVGVGASCARDADGRVTLDVQVFDTGIGIPEEQQSRIFEQFSQADETVERRYGGTGLGLAIVKHLVTAMGGQLTVMSEVGKGSTFRFRIPFDVHDEVSVESALLDGEAVYLVSEDAEVRSQVAAIVSARGGNLIDVPTPARLLSGLNKGITVQPRPLVFFDTKSSEVSPAEFARMVRAHNDRLRPVMILLGGDADGASQEAEDDVRRHYLASLDLPADEVQLAQAVYFSCYVTGRVSQEERNLLGSAFQQHRKMRVLLAEDNQVNQKVLSKILETAGHTVVGVSTGDQALDALEEQEFDIALMDLNMPGMGGAEAVKLYRFSAMDEDPLPILALTADATPEAHTICEEAGMNGLLTKPIEPDELLEALQRYGRQGDGAADGDRADDARTSPQVAAAAAVGRGPGSNVAAHPKRGDILPPIVDERAVDSLRMLGDDAFFADLVTEFITDTESYIARVADAVAANDAGEVRDAAHAVRSAAGHFGAQRLFKLCMSVNRITQEELREKGAKFLEDLRRETDLVAKELSEYQVPDYPAAAGAN